MRKLGSDFGWLWSAYAVSTYGTWLAFGAFPLIAVRVLDSSAFAVSLLEAAGLAVAAGLAIPLGPWVAYRPKLPVMIATDLVRFAALASVPAAYALGVLSYGQLLVVAVVCGTAGITFTAASGAYLKSLARGDRLLAANGRFEATSWAATAAPRARSTTASSASGVLPSASRASAAVTRGSARTPACARTCRRGPSRRGSR